MPVEVRRISDGAIYPDFQLPGGDGSTQLASAIANGFGTAQTLQVVTVDMPTFLNDVQAAYGAIITANATARAAVRARVVTLCQSAVGVQIENLTAAQIKALLAALLFDQGMLDNNGVVAPLANWLAN